VSSHAPSVFKLGCGSSVVCRLLSLVGVRTHTLSRSLSTHVLAIEDSRILYNYDLKALGAKG
jgi:hypothetical protein